MPDRSVTYEFRAKFDSFKAQLAAGGKSVDDFGKKLTGLDKQGAKMRQGLSTLGSIGGKVALGAAAGLTAIVAVTANFEKAMSSVAAATGEGEAGMKALRDAALQAGADTAFSASEAAGGIEALAKAGVSTQDILGGGLTGALDLAAAGSIDVATAAEQAATAMTQFGLSGADVPHIADLLAAAAGKAQGEVTDFGQALNQAGLIADQVGLSIEETTGGLAAFASAGLLGSDAGTSFKTMLGALTPNSAKAKTAMDELGISAYDAQGNFIGLADFADNLKSSLADMSDEQRQATLETIFGSDAVRAASILYEQGGEGIQSWIDKTNDAGFAAETAATKLDNLAGDFEALKGSLETALIGAGSDSQGPLRKLVQTLTDVVNGFNNLPGPAKSATTALLGVTAVLGGGLWFTSKVVQGIADTKKALSDLGIQAGRTKSVLVGLGSAASIIAVAIPILQKINGLLLDQVAIGSGNLQRDLESISKGVSTDAIDDFVNQLQGLSSTGQDAHEALSEVNTAFGLFGDTAGDKATQNIKDVDEALASLVESGNAEQAAVVVDRLRESYKEAGGDIADVDAALTQYDQALKNAGLRTSFVRDILAGAGLAAAGAAGPTDDLAGATDDLGNSATGATRDLKGLVAAMLKQADAALAAFDAETAYRQAMKAADKQADKNNAGIDGSSDAALKNRDALSGLASAWNNQSASVRNNTEKFHEAKKAFIDTAIAMGVPRKAAEALARELLAIPKSTVAHVNAEGAEQATASVHGLITALSSVHDKTVHINTVFSRNNLPPPGSGIADGGTVPGQRHPYGDKVPALLAPGEEVVTNRHGEADRFRADRAAGRIPAYGDGGTADLYERRNRVMASPSGSVLSTSVDAPGWDDRSLVREVRALRRDVNAIGAAQVAATDRQTQSAKHGSSAAARSNKGGW